MSKNYECFEELFLNCLRNSQRLCSRDITNKITTELSSVVKNYQVSDSPNFSKPANLWLQRNGFNNDV